MQVIDDSYKYILAKS